MKNTQGHEATDSSLYRELATTPRWAGDPRPGPGTIETHAIETVDNDVATTLIMLPADDG